jgi:hypothetical protein
MDQLLSHRRLYLYLLAWASLGISLWAITALAHYLSAGGNVFSLWVDSMLILTALPLLVLSWWRLQRDAIKVQDDRSTPTRAVFLYGALLMTLAGVALNSVWLLDRSLAENAGLSPQSVSIGAGQTAVQNLVGIIVNGAAAAYLFSVLHSDWKALPAENVYGFVRRCYRYLWLVIGLGMAMLGTQQLLLFFLGIWQNINTGMQAQLANGLSLLVIGVPAWLIARIQIERSWVDEQEAGSPLRNFVFYALAWISLAGILIFIARLLALIFSGLSGGVLSGQTLLQDISLPLSFAFPLAVVLYYAGKQLNLDPRGLLIPAAPSMVPSRTASVGYQMNVKRIYRYALALLGLSFAFTGLQLMAAFFLSSLLQTTTEASQYLPTSLALLLVGLPVWWSNWIPLARQTPQIGEASDSLGDSPRRFRMRRAYLFLVCSVGIAGILFSAGILLYRIFSYLLSPSADKSALQIVQPAAALLLFAILIGYHGPILRKDLRLAQAALARRRALFPVLVLAPEQGNFAHLMVNTLEQNVPGLPVAVHPIDQGAPDETLSAAKAVILPAELVAHPPEAIRLWLQGFGGVRIVVPIPVKDWCWLSGEKSLSPLAYQAALLIRRLSES